MPHETFKDSSPPQNSHMCVYNFFLARVSQIIASDPACANNGHNIDDLSLYFGSKGPSRSDPSSWNRFDIQTLRKVHGRAWSPSW
ncbi:hypothetical protein VTN00DRAFT_1800 [Thermoascus crustaceus]|uniref:uncharacterized protein n=1 Tax=Thermoascus crustaceus TaxID=5088 RepID=UPI0037449FD4